MQNQQEPDCVVSDMQALQPAVEASLTLASVAVEEQIDAATAAGPESLTVASPVSPPAPVPLAAGPPSNGVVCGGCQHVALLSHRLRHCRYCKLSSEGRCMKQEGDRVWALLSSAHERECSQA